MAYLLLVAAFSTFVVDAVDVVVVNDAGGQ